MSLAGVHVLERESRVMRGMGRVAPLLKREMKARGVSAKELALLMRAWAAEDPGQRQALDFRTIQHAMEGSGGLETFFALAGFFGWDFAEEVLTPVHGADPLTAREKELAQKLGQAAALHARLERDRAARAVAGGPLAVVARAATVQSARPRGEGRTFDPKAPQGA